MPKVPKTPPSVIICNKALKKFFNLHSPLITQDYSTWTLNGKDSIFETFDEKDNRYTLWEFPIDNEFAIYHPIYFYFNVKVSSNYEITELNIKIFKEDFTKPKSDTAISTELLLRVEWSNDTKVDAKHMHAQPHWHIHSYKILDKLTNISSEEKDFILKYIESSEKKESIFTEIEDQVIEVEEDVAQENISSKIPHYKLHLSMLSDWHLNDGTSPYIKLTDKILEKWLPQCLLYIKDQFEYIFERMAIH